MNDRHDPIDSFISEISASLNQPDPQAFLRRVNAERMLVLLLDDLASELQENIRILPDKRLTGDTGADFLIQVDDYDFHLELIDSPDGSLTLSEEQLQASVRLLEDNPSTLALIVVWTTDDLRAIPLSLARIRYLLQKPNRIAALVRQAKSVQEVMRDLVQRQVKIWDVSLNKTSMTAGQGVDILQVFSKEVDKAIAHEMDRKYRNEERSRAAKMYPYQTEKPFIISVLKDALQGVEAKRLIDRFVRVPSRGRR